MEELKLILSAVQGISVGAMWVGILWVCKDILLALIWAPVVLFGTPKVLKAIFAGIKNLED